MFWKFLRESLWRARNRRRVIWAVLTVTLGAAVVAALLSVWLDIGDKMAKELSSIGPNVTLGPAGDSLPLEMGGIDYRPVSEGAYLSESSLPKIKEIFWRNNIAAFSPFLYLRARASSVSADGLHPPSGAVATNLVGVWFDHSFDTSDGAHFHTGVRSLEPAWKVDGEWVEDSRSGGASVGLVGRSLAESLGVKPGDILDVSPAQGSATDSYGPAVAFRVSGILTTGGSEDNQILVPLAVVQSLAGMADKVRKVELSAVIKPEDDLSRRDPSTLSPAQYDRWYCSPYLSSIVHQIQEALPGAAAAPIRTVSETQGNILGKLTFLMATLAIFAVVAMGLSISSLSSMAVLERRAEIGLMKAIGAQDWIVAALFCTEAALQGVIGGAIGFGVGRLLARFLSKVVFGADLAMNWAVLPLILIITLGVSLLATLLPLRRAVHLRPAGVLRGE